MPSTDIDGSPIVILSEARGKTILGTYRYLNSVNMILPQEREVAEKIAKELNLPGLSPAKPEE